VPNSIETLRSDRFARSILDVSSDCILVLDAEGSVNFVNATGARLFGTGDPSAGGADQWIDRFPHGVRHTAAAALRTARSGETATFSACVAGTGNSDVWLDVTVNPIRATAGDVSHIVLVARDVTSTRKAFEEVDFARKRLSSVLSSTTDSIISVDRDFTLTYVNERAAALVGASVPLEVGNNLWEAYPSARGSEFHQNYLRAFETQSSVHFESYLDELNIWLDVHAYPNGDALSIFFRDITNERLSRKELHYMAHHDSLTGLPNRAVLLARLESAQQAAASLSTSLAVIYIDLDDFKAVNDTLGHDAGDALLVATARRLQDCIGNWGCVSRVGGDEFAILLDDNVSQDTIEKLVLELQQRLSAPVDYQGTQVSSRASFGIALFPDSDSRPSELFKNADLALYQAKRAGGNQYAFFHPRIRQFVQQRMSALSCARDALDRDAILPFYQPKVSFKTGAVVGLEALLRWTHGREGIQPPHLIKEAFEDPVLSVELGRRMLTRVLADMRSWREEGLNFGSVAINVSAPEFNRGDFATHLFAQLQAQQLPPSSLEIEVTETVFLDDGTNRVEQALGELHRGGVSIALDDFGTGHASLTHLNKFPVSCLKIDRSFVAGLGEDPDTTAIIRAVLNLSKTMHINVVAEGVETIGQWKMLKRMGCDTAQGYFVSRPIGATQVPHFLEQWAGAPRAVSSKTRAVQR
jgi:diguanylate cyclase (GGDEF)-like protein/PAS domain S-box-containing protein